MKRFKLHDDSINTYGFRMLTEGADLEQFKRNPVMLYDHDDYKRLPIGKWDNISIEKDGIYADAVFDMKDPFAAQISSKVDDGFLNMASVGAVIISESNEPDVMLPGQSYPTITKWRMREASVTPFGSNHNALSLYDESGKRIELNEKSLVNIFDKSKPETTNIIMKQLLNALKLKDTSTETEGVTAVNALEQRAVLAETQLADYKKKEDDARKAEIVCLLDAAQAEQRIDDKGRASYQVLFEKDFEAAKIALSGIPKRQTAKTIVNSDSKADEKLIEMSWDDLDRSGNLAKLKEKFPEVYKEKFEEKFSK